MTISNLLDALRRDLGYGLRILKANPGFTVVAVLSLALGIGANSAIFQLIDAVRLKSLPVQKPEELVEVRIATRSARTGSFTSRYARLTNAQWEQIRDQQQAFSGTLAFSVSRFNLAPSGEGRYAQGLLVSGDFFNVLGATPILGRVLTPQDDVRACGSPGAVISHAFWQREFNGASDVVGRKINLDGKPFDVTGVTSASFFGVEVGRSFDVAIPICAETLLRGKDSRLESKSAWWLASFARLKPGWTPESANTHLQAISEGIFKTTLPERYRQADIDNYLKLKLGAFPASTGVSRLRESFENPLWMLLGITGMVLLIACANLANLMLARASVRERELAVRLAIGASRWRLIRQLLAESFLLSMIGAAFGALLAQALSRFLVASLATGANPIFVSLGIDWRLFGFIAGLAIVTCLLFGIVPAFRATEASPNEVLKAGSRGVAGGRRGAVLRRALVVSQVALSLLLLVGALLFARSFRNLATLDTGFARDGVLRTSLSFERVSNDEERLKLMQKEVFEKIQSLAEVQSVATAAIVPVSGSGWNDNFRIDGESHGDKQTPLSDFNMVSPGYFRTLEVPFVGGRDFDATDTNTSPPVAIVNEAFSKKFLNGQNPIGRIIRVEVGAGQPQPFYQIVGVVRNTKYRDVREDFGSIVFLSSQQTKDVDTSMQLVVRSRVSVSALTGAIKNAVATTDPAITIDFQTFRAQIGDALLQERLMALLSGFFGLLAAILATIGLYGVMSYMVSSRRSEIGIRVALGAGRKRVIGLVLREAMVLLSIGLVGGVALAIAAGRTAKSMLFGLEPTDPITIAVAVFLLALVGLLAGFIPARRAAAVDPMEVLRAE